MHRVIAAGLLGALLVVAGCSDDGSENPMRSSREEFKGREMEARVRAQRVYAEEKARAMEAEAGEMRQEVEKVTQALAAIETQLAEAERDLAAAESQAERAKALEAIQLLHQRRTEVELQIEMRKRSLKLRCPPTDPLC